MFKFCSQQQLQLLPSLLDEHLEEDHLAGFISAAVNQFDITILGQSETYKNAVVKRKFFAIAHLSPFCDPQDPKW